MIVLKLDNLDRMDCGIDGFVPDPHAPYALTWRDPDQYLPGGTFFICTLKYGVQEDPGPVVKALTLRPGSVPTPEEIRNVEAGVHSLYGSMNAAYLSQLSDVRQDYSHTYTDHGSFRTPGDMAKHLATCSLRSQEMSHGLRDWVSENQRAPLEGFDDGTTFGQWVDREILRIELQLVPNGS